MMLTSEGGTMLCSQLWKKNEIKTNISATLDQTLLLFAWLLVRAWWDGATEEKTHWAKKCPKKDLCWMFKKAPTEEPGSRWKKQTLSLNKNVEQKQTKEWRHVRRKHRTGEQTQKRKTNWQRSREKDRDWLTDREKENKDKKCNTLSK